MGTPRGGTVYRDRSGSKVALSADGLVFAEGGMYHEAPGAAYAGRVRVFAWSADSNDWQQRGPDIPGIAHDQIRTVALSADGTVVAVGGPAHSSNRGIVRVYDWDGASTSYVPRADPSNLLQGDWHHWYMGDQAGNAVALSADGSIVAFGLHEATPSATGIEDAGSVRVFKWESGTWTLMGAELVLQGARANDEYGASVALSDDGHVLAVGVAQFDHPDCASNRGQVRARLHQLGVAAAPQRLRQLEPRSSRHVGGAERRRQRAAVGGARRWQQPKSEPRYVRLYTWDGQSYVQQMQLNGKTAAKGRNDVRPGSGLERRRHGVRGGPT